MTARTPPGRSTRSQAANTRPGSCARPRRPAAGRSSRGRGSRRRPARPSRRRGRRGAAAPPGRRAAAVRGRAGDEGEDAPAGGCRGLDDRRRAAGGGDQVAGEGERVDDPPGGCGGDRAAARQAVPGVAGGGQAGPDAQRHAGTCPAGRAAPGRCGVRDRAGRQAVPGAVEGLCHGGWSRVPPLSALTLHKSGFRGLFSRARRRNIPGGVNYQGNLAGKISPGPCRARARPFTTGRVPARVPAMYLAGAVQVSALMYLAGSGRRAARRAGHAAAGPEAGGRRYMPGTRQVQARYTPGRREVHRRSTPGQSGVAGWGFVPVRLAHLELSHG